VKSVVGFKGLYTARYKKKEVFVRVTNMDEIVALSKCKKKTTGIVLIIHYIDQPHKDIPELEDPHENNVAAIYFTENLEVLTYNEHETIKKDKKRSYY